MQAFGPGHIDHRRVPWPPEMQSPSIQLPSSVLNLFRHNALPSPDQEFAAKNFQTCLSDDILRNKQEEKDVESQIRQLEKELKRIRSARECVDRQMLACNVALSPFRRLPDDIVYNIALQFCFGSGSKAGEGPHRALILGRISRAFRHIVRSTPAFWKEMRIQCWKGAPFEQRSLPTNHVSDDRSYETVTDLPSVPLTRNRLQKLIIQYPKGHCINLVSMFLALCFPSVTDLKLQFFTAKLTSAEKVAGDGSMALPNLQTLELRFMPNFKRWVTSSKDRLTELLENIAEVRNSTYAARIAVMEENRTHSAQQNGGFRFSICFNWDESDQRFREWALNFNVMHAYFTELRDNFKRDGTPIQVHLRQEKFSEASKDYLKDEFLQYF